MKKKVMMAAAILCLGLLLWIGCGMEREDIIPSSSRGTAGAYAMPGPGDASTEAYVMPSASGGETEETLIPVSSSGEMGMYIMPGPFDMWGHGAAFALSAVINWDDFRPPEEEKDLRIKLSYEEEEKILDELTEFCNGHREKLNEMSEYFINALEGISDYNDRKNLPDIEELAGAFTDEESREILEKLEPYYPYGIDCSSRLKWVSYFYHCDDYNEEEYVIPKFRVEYIKADEEELMNIFYGNGYIWTTQKIDKYLYAVMKRWHSV